jgi:hypothetical protein
LNTLSSLAGVLAGLRVLAMAAVVEVAVDY